MLNIILKYRDAWFERKTFLMDCRESGMGKRAFDKN